MDRPPLVPTIAAGLGFSALAAAVLGPALAFSGAVAPMAGFQIFLLSILLGLSALIVGVVGLIVNRGAAGRAWQGIGAGAAIVVIVAVAGAPGRGLPRINDISTDLVDPPAFEAALRDEANRGRDMSYPDGFAEQVREAYPDLEPVRLDVPPDEAFARAVRAAEDLGWEIVTRDAAAGRLEAREASGLFRFVDDVVVRVRADGAGSVVDVRSKSRDGQGDLGVNAARIRAFVTHLR